MRNAISVISAVLIGLLLTSFSQTTALADIDIRIDKSSQLMTVAIDGRHRYTWKVSTGKAGYTTPSGTFTPFRMERHHRSDEWDNAPMPHSIFFTYQGHAIHGSPHTRRLGTAVSHGCVRLAPQNARKLFSLVTRQGLGNTNVTIADGGIASSEPRLYRSGGNAHVQWCDRRYRSYRASDNTFQPNDGARRPCVSPYGR